MKTIRAAIVVVMFLVLTVPALGESSDLQMSHFEEELIGAIRDEGNQSISSGTDVPATLGQIFDSVERQVLCDNIAEYYIYREHNDCHRVGYRVFVKEDSPWYCQNITHVVVMQPGEAIKSGFYSKWAIASAKEGALVLIVDRPETFIENKSECQGMNWTMQMCMEDNYHAILCSRYLAVLLNDTPKVTTEKMDEIKVVLKGHSLGGLIVVNYTTLRHTFLLGGFENLIVEEMVIKYDPSEEDLIESQGKNHMRVLGLMENAVYNEEMLQNHQVTYLALMRPDEFDMDLNLTNIEVWRSSIAHTHLFMQFPYTPEYAILSGDISGLYEVNETQVMESVLENTCPYSPLEYNRFATGITGNVEGYEAYPSQIDVPTLYIGLPPGFGLYGASWFTKVARHNPEVTILIWRYTGHAGGVFNDYASEVWRSEREWIRQQEQHEFTIPIGDVNRNGVIDTADVVITLRMAARGEYNRLADVNGDWRVTSLDALMIQQSIMSSRG